MDHVQSLRGARDIFPELRTLLAKASLQRSGDDLASLSVESSSERVADQMALTDLSLRKIPERSGGGY